MAALNLLSYLWLTQSRTVLTQSRTVLASLLSGHSAHSSLLSHRDLPSKVLSVPSQAVRYLIRLIHLSDLYPGYLPRFSSTTLYCLCVGLMGERFKMWVKLLDFSCPREIKNSTPAKGSGKGTGMLCHDIVRLLLEKRYLKHHLCLSMTINEDSTWILNHPIFEEGMTSYSFSVLWII